MITTTNYIEKTKTINLSQLPDNLKKAHEWVLKATENGTNWNAYENKQIKAVIDTTISKLNEFVGKHTPVVPPVVPKAPASETEHKAKPAVRKEHVSTQKTKQKAQEPENDFEFVERIPEEIRFIRRYLSLNGKKKTKEDLLRFINALHRAIIEKKVRKSSPYAKQMEYIQEKLIKTYNSMGRTVVAEISDKTISEFKALIAEQKVMPSVMLIKRYITLNGKYDVKEKAKVLMEAMTRAVHLKKVSKTDKYAKILDAMFANLNSYVKNKSQKVLSIQETELNGLNGILAGCGCETVNGDEPESELNGLEGVSTAEEVLPKPTGVMSSMVFKNMQFRTLGFTGKYLKLIGDPARGFTAMVYGKPKMGKSYLCVDFAGYLARNHGKVLYIAKEEGLDMTLQEKLKAKDVAHPNLFVAEEIPEGLSPYDFIFFDSVNKLGLSVQDLEALKRANQGKSFIYIFQTTKDGSFRGANEFQHDVDVVIEVPEKGLAVQNGRFNQGGEMRIFEG
jgi:hypothetical protein